MPLIGDDYDVASVVGQGPLSSTQPASVVWQITGAVQACYGAPAALLKGGVKRGFRHVIAPSFTRVEADCGEAGIELDAGDPARRANETGHDGRVVADTRSNMNHVVTGSNVGACKKRRRKWPR
jgi:hypothetical protein